MPGHTEHKLLNPGSLTIASCIVLIVAGVLPVVFSFHPAPTFERFSQSPMLEIAGEAFVLLILLGVIFLIARMDHMQMPAKLVLYAGLLLLALVLTDMHWHMVDMAYQECTTTPKLAWQIDQYANIIAGKEGPPHQYRFLPQGIVWWLFLGSGDFCFAYVVYRAFFTFAFCLSLYKLSRIYIPHKDSLIVVLLYAMLYPLSIHYYYGNLLDPMFHLIFVLSMIYCWKGRLPEFAFLVTTGMLVKETTILLIPCYYLMNMESPGFGRKKAILWLGLLAAWCMVVFLLCRIPFGFQGNNSTLNGVDGLMIAKNLWVTLEMSLWVRYMHPILFILLWIPIVVLYRRFISRPLFCTTIYLAVSIYLTNLCFGWNFESRNFIPAFCLLAISMISILRHMNADGNDMAIEDNTSKPQTTPQTGKP
jgi:hypothetical protein